MSGSTSGMDWSWLTQGALARGLGLADSGAGWSGLNAPGSVDIGGGWGAAPGMTDKGYGLPDASKGPDSWWDRNISSKGLADALGGAAKGAGGGQAGAGKGPIMPTMGGGGGGGGGHGTAQNLGVLLQILNNRRDALLNSATGGVGAGQVPQQQRTQGLLGF